MADKKWSEFLQVGALNLTDYAAFLQAGQNVIAQISVLVDTVAANILGSDIDADHNAVNYSPAGSTIADHLAAIDANFSVIDGGTF